MTNEEIQDIFFLECEEALDVAEDGLMQCRDGLADADTVNSIFRSVHSIKGGAGAFSFNELQAFTHKFETVLSYVRDGDLPLGDTLNALMLRAFDVLSDHVNAARGLADAPDDAAVSAELEHTAELAASGQSLPEGDTDGEAEAPVAEAAAETEDALGLDFDLDGLLGDLEFKDEGEGERAETTEVSPPCADEGMWMVTVRPHGRKCGQNRLRER